MPSYIVIGIAAAVALVVVVILFKATWRVAEPNEALIISGLGARGASPDTADSLGFKIVTGKGAVVLPGFQTARRLVLDSRVARLEVSCVTRQGIPVHVRGIVIYKIGDDYASIANAARRFLDQQDRMDEKTHTLFAGHLRSIVGSLTVEEMIHNREALTSEVRQSSSVEMSKLGLVVDSLQIQEIEDTAGYIENLGKPHAAAVAAAARIAGAQRDQEATEAEQVANANKAAASRDSQLKQASFQAEIDRANAHTKQAGPLAEATARQEVVVQETRAAELEAQLAEQRLVDEAHRVRAYFAVQWGRGKVMTATYHKYLRGTATREEMEHANAVLRDYLKIAGLGTLLILPGAPVTIPLVAKVGKALGVDVFPKDVEAEMT